MKRALIPLLFGGKKRAATPWYLAGGVDAANCVAAYQAVGAASYAASKINLANPGTYDLADGANFPTWDTADGWTFATNNYLLTGITPSTGWSAFVLSSNMTTAGHYFAGRSASPNEFSIIGSDGTGVLYRNGGVVGLQKLPPATTERVAFSFSGNVAYRNGIAESGTIPDPIDNAWKAIAIGARILSNDTLGSFLSGKIQFVAFWNTALSAAQQLAVYNAVLEQLSTSYTLSNDIYSSTIEA